jgi:hypothetical protein
MTTLGFYEGRTHFSRLLDQVARGEESAHQPAREGAGHALSPAEETKDVGHVIAAM